jgi:hypothetical protein
MEFKINDLYLQGWDGGDEGAEPLVADTDEFTSSVGKAIQEQSSVPKQGKAVKEERLSLSDFCAYAILGNEQFIATGKTTNTLTPGMYRFYMPNKDIVISRMHMVTDNLFKLADTVSLKVLESIATFWKSKERFDHFGMLFKRGILLYGPPGSGKTVTVTLLANQLIEMGGIVTFCESPGVTSRGIQIIRRIEPDRPIVNIIEDIDTIVERSGDEEILSLLDGENQVANIVHVATTNYPERLDPRLVNRPSRFDEIRKVGMPSANVRKSYLCSVLPDYRQHEYDNKNAELERWIKDTEGFSMAHLRELIIAVRCLGRDYETTIKRLETMIRNKPKGRGNSATGFVGTEEQEA